jgi:hypothetical protein
VPTLLLTADLPIDLAAVANLHDQDQQNVISDLIQDPMVPHPQPPNILGTS